MKPLWTTPSTKRISPEAMAPTIIPSRIGETMLASENSRPQRFWCSSPRES